MIIAYVCCKVSTYLLIQIITQSRLPIMCLKYNYFYFFFHVRSNNNETRLRYKYLKENLFELNRNSSCLAHAACDWLPVHCKGVVSNMSTTTVSVMNYHMKLVNKQKLYKNTIGEMLFDTFFSCFFFIFSNRIIPLSSWVERMWSNIINDILTLIFDSFYKYQYVFHQKKTQARNI